MPGSAAAERGKAKGTLGTKKAKRTKNGDKKKDLPLWGKQAPGTRIKRGASVWGLGEGHTITVSDRRKLQPQRKPKKS